MVAARKGIGMGVNLTFRTDGKRLANRSRVLLAIRLDTPSGSVDARIRDLSARGALVECSKVLPVGTKVTFVRGAFDVPARIAWVAGGRAGLEFEAPIDEREVLVKLRRSRKEDMSARFEAPRVSRAMTRQQRRLAEAWGVTVGLTVSAAWD